MPIEDAVIVVSEARQIVSPRARTAWIVAIVELDKAPAAEEVGLPFEAGSVLRGEDLFDRGYPWTRPRPGVHLEIPSRDAQL